MIAFTNTACAGWGSRTMEAYVDASLAPQETALIVRSASVKLDDSVPKSGMTINKIQALYQTNLTKMVLAELNDDRGLGEVRRFRAKAGRPALIPRQLEVGSTTLPWHVPSDGEVLEAKDGTPPFILIIDRCELGFEERRTSLAAKAGNIYSDLDRRLYHRIYFSFWDNRSGALVTYGRVIDGKQARLDKKTFRMMVDDVVDAIIGALPLD